MKLAGVVFVLLSACSVGLRISLGMKKRCAYLRRFLHVLQQMRNELAFLTTPLPTIFATAAETADGDMRNIFLSVSSCMEENRWMTPRNAAGRALARYPDELLGDIILELAEKLGSYDIEAQLGGIDCACADTRQLLQSMEEEMSVRSKTYEILSICAGLALVILLI